MLLGHSLSRDREARFEASEAAIFDLWVGFVMPSTVFRPYLELLGPMRCTQTETRSSQSRTIGIATFQFRLCALRCGDKYSTAEYGSELVCCTVD
jgi:hypothetical protein